MPGRMFYCFLIITFIGSFHFASAQFLENKLNVHAGCSVGFFQGNSAMEKDNFRFPTLYPNLKNLNGYSFKALYTVHDHLSVGVGMTNMRASKWSFNSQEVYSGSEVTLGSGAALFQFHNKARETGVFNRIKYFLELAPTLGAAKLTLAENIFAVEDGRTIEPPASSMDKYYGIGASLGIEYGVTQLVGINADYSFAYNWIKSSLYVDERFSFSQVTLGIYVKLLKEKRYFY